MAHETERGRGERRVIKECIRVEERAHLEKLEVRRATLLVNLANKPPAGLMTVGQGRNNLQSLCNSCLPLEWVTMTSPGKLDMMNCIEGS
jgi:hypothetical protein